MSVEAPRLYWRSRPPPCAPFAAMAAKVSSPKKVVPVQEQDVRNDADPDEESPDSDTKKLDPSMLSTTRLGEGPKRSLWKKCCACFIRRSFPELSTGAMEAVDMLRRTWQPAVPKRFRLLPCSSCASSRFPRAVQSPGVI